MKILHQISDYQGASACWALLPFVFRCDAEECVDVSRTVPNYYRDYRDVQAERLPCESQTSVRPERKV